MLNNNVSNEIEQNNFEYLKVSCTDNTLSIDLEEAYLVRFINSLTLNGVMHTLNKNNKFDKLSDRNEERIRFLLSLNHDEITELCKKMFEVYFLKDSKKLEPNEYKKHTSTKAYDQIDRAYDSLKNKENSEDKLAELIFGPHNDKKNNIEYDKTRIPIMLEMFLANNSSYTRFNTMKRGKHTNFSYKLMDCEQKQRFKNLVFEFAKVKNLSNHEITTIFNDIGC